MSTTSEAISSSIENWLLCPLAAKTEQRRREACAGWAAAVSRGHTVEMTKSFKELDLIYRVPEELLMEVYDTVQEAVIKTILKKKKCKKAKWLSEEALQIAEKREAKHKREKERYTHLNAEFQRIAKRHKKAFLREPCI